MNWGEIQIESLKKMYLNNTNIVTSELETLKNDKRYRTYLYSMPQACNEAIRKILNVKPNIKSYVLKYKDGVKKYELKKIIPKFKQLSEVIYSGNQIPIYHFEGDNIFVVDNWNNENESFTIYYESYHDLMRDSTTSGTVIDLDKESVILIPLYIAAELYKDDDIQQATIWMNEFESALSEIRESRKELNSNPNSITTVYGVDW